MDEKQELRRWAVERSIELHAVAWVKTDTKDPLPPLIIAADTLCRFVENGFDGSRLMSLIDELSGSLGSLMRNLEHPESALKRAQKAQEAASSERDRQLRYMYGDRQGGWTSA